MYGTAKSSGSIAESSAIGSSAISDSMNISESVGSDSLGSSGIGSSGISGSIGSSGMGSSGIGSSGMSSGMNPSGQSGGSGSGSSSCICDFTITDIVYSSGDNSGTFSITNNGTCELTIIGFDGVGFINFPDLPFAIPPGDTNAFGVLDVFDTVSAWRIETTECGFSEEQFWP